MRPIFHHAFTVLDLEATRKFYGELLGLTPGRRANDKVSVDYDFFGHHIVAHATDGDSADAQRRVTDGEAFRIRHFGVILDWTDFEGLADRLREKGAKFLVEPRVLHEGEAREEALMMLWDPSGNAIEFKTFRDLRHLFGTA